MRTLHLPVGAERRGNLIQAVPNLPKSSKISKQFCEIATAASGLAMTKSDIIDSLRIVLGKPNAIFVCLALWLAGSAGDVALLDQLVAGAVAVGAVAVLDALGRAAVRIVELSGVGVYDVILRGF